MRVCTSLVLCWLGQAGAVLAQEPAETHAIRNGRIVTVTGPIMERGTVLISNGKITDIGADVSVPSEAKIIDASGLSIYPGMIDAGSLLGLIEIDQIDGTVDTSEIGDNNSDARVDTAINPDSVHIAITRVNGITTAHSVPRGGIISGQSALLNLDGWVGKDMSVRSSVAMNINWPQVVTSITDPGSVLPRRFTVAEARARQEKRIETLRKILLDAKAYGHAKDARLKHTGLPRQDVDLKLEALIPVVRGEMPAIIFADEERDIKNAVAFADEMKLKMVLSSGLEAYKVADLLKARNIPVIVGPVVLRSPQREDDPYDMAFANAGLLAKAGVKIAFQTLDGANARNLPYQAAIAAAFGLPKEEALKAVTIYPAQIFGVADRIGSIEPGKVANLIVTDGDPLEILTRVKYLFINGRQVPLTSKHTDLYEKYKARPLPRRGH